MAAITDLQKPLLDQAEEQLNGGSRASTPSDTVRSRELTEVGSEVEEKAHEVTTADLLAADSPSRAATRAVEYKGVTPPKEGEEEEPARRPEQGRHWKTTNYGRWFGRRKRGSKEEKCRREPVTWNGKSTRTVGCILLFMNVSLQELLVPQGGVNTSDTPGGRFLLLPALHQAHLWGLRPSSWVTCKTSMRGKGSGSCLV